MNKSHLTPTFSRRQFLQITAVTGGLLAAGYGGWQTVAGSKNGRLAR
jgi:anaerobic selenocysteine-containing dehydrogenase